MTWKRQLPLFPLRPIDAHWHVDEAEREQCIACNPITGGHNEEIGGYPPKPFRGDAMRLDVRVLDAQLWERYIKAADDEPGFYPRYPEIYEGCCDDPACDGCWPDHIDTNDDSECVE